MYTQEEEKELRQLFWQKLDNKAKRLPMQKGRRKSWTFDRTGIKGLDLRFDVDREKACVALEINHRSEERRIILYEKLYACKTIFENEYGLPLLWERNYLKPEGKTVCRAYNQMACDMYNQDLWPDIMHFLIDHMLRMRNNFV